MLEYLEYLNLPVKIGVAIVGLFLISQVIGELIELKGKTVPEIIKIRKYFARKKKERQTMRDMVQTIDDVKKTLNELNMHYSTDNINMRDNWIKSVNSKLEQNDIYIKKLEQMLDKNNRDTLSLLVDSKRNSIINFASFVIDGKTPVTREQFNRIFKLYEEYEEIIKSNGMTNGEVDIAIRIIKEAYECHMKNHTFVEDLKGY